MGNVSKRTKQCKTRKNIFGFLHILCMLGPLLYFLPYGYITGATTEKLCLSFTVIVSIILAFISLVISTVHRQGLHRCILWTLIAGVLFTLTEVKVFIWIMCVTSILDELIFVKIKDYYKACLIANREIDKRG